MREMDAKINMCLGVLARKEQQQEQSVQATVKALEDRIFGRVGAALEEMDGRLRATDAKVNGPTAKFMESIALEQIDIRTKLDRSVAPLLQSLAQGHIDLKVELDGLGAELRQGRVEAAPAPVEPPKAS